MINAVYSLKYATFALKILLVVTISFQLIKISSVKSNSSNERIDSILNYKKEIRIKTIGNEIPDNGVVGQSHTNLRISKKHDLNRFKFQKATEIKLETNNLNVLTEHTNNIELFEINQLINNCKKSIFKSLIYLVIVFNIVLICVLFLKNSMISEVYLGRRFFYYHMILNIFLLVSI